MGSRNMAVFLLPLLFILACILQSDADPSDLHLHLYGTKPGNDNKIGLETENDYELGIANSTKAPCVFTLQCEPLYEKDVRLHPLDYHTCFQYIPIPCTHSLTTLLKDCRAGYEKCNCSNKNCVCLTGTCANQFGCTFKENMKDKYCHATAAHVE